MPVAAELQQLQQAFLAALYGEGDGPLAHIEGAGLAPRARLDIYRHASELIHLGALATSYPAVRALVGEAYFERVALAFRRASPSSGGNLQGFGETFPGFLASRPETAPWPCLGDVARLEWLRQSCALAADAAALDVVAFAAQMASAMDDVVLALHPSVRVLASRHAVASIWRFAIAEGVGAEPPARDEPGEYVALWREDGDVVVSTLEPASFVFLQALAEGQWLAHAHAQAAAIDPAFDLVASVHRLIDHALLVGVVSPDACRARRVARDDA